MKLLGNTGRIRITALVLLAVAILGTAVYSVYGYLLAKPPQMPRAVQGILDLRGWDFGKDGVLSLEGEWEFYWQQLLAPGDFRNGGSDFPDDSSNSEDSGYSRGVGSNLAGDSSDSQDSRSNHESGSQVSRTGFIRVPGIWNGYEITEEGTVHIPTPGSKKARVSVLQKYPA